MTADRAARCPDCGTPITVGYMCADCADRIATDWCFEGIFGDIPAEKVAMIVSYLSRVSSDG